MKKTMTALCMAAAASWVMTAAAQSAEHRRDSQTKKRDKSRRR